MRIAYANKNGYLAATTKQFFLIIKKHITMYLTMNRCGHLYTKIPYSKPCL